MTQYIGGFHSRDFVTSQVWFFTIKLKNA